MTDGLPPLDDYRLPGGAIDWESYRKAAVLAATADAFDEVEELREEAVAAVDEIVRRESEQPSTE